jgi:hypothetical protein
MARLRPERSPPDISPTPVMNISSGKRLYKRWNLNGYFRSPGTPTRSIPLSITQTSPRPWFEFRLEPKDKGTVLYLTESGFDALPKDRRFEAFRMNDEGWTEQTTNIEHHLKQRS